MFMIKNASKFRIILLKIWLKFIWKIEIIVLYEILLKKYSQTASSLLKTTKKNCYFRFLSGEHFVYFLQGFLSTMLFDIDKIIRLKKL